MGAGIVKDWAQFEPVTRGRITLRPYRMDELDQVHAAFQAGDERTWPSGPPPRHKVRRRLQKSGRFVSGKMDVAIEVDGRLVGEVQARHPQNCLPDGVFTLGIELFERSDRGKGLGREALALFTGHLFEFAGAHRVELTTDVDNTPMQRSAEAAGFAREGVLREFMPSSRGLRDYVQYAMTRTDWESRKKTWTFRS